MIRKVIFLCIACYNCIIFDSVIIVFKVLISFITVCSFILCNIKIISTINFFCIGEGNCYLVQNINSDVSLGALLAADNSLGIYLSASGSHGSNSACAFINSCYFGVIGVILYGRCVSACGRNFKIPAQIKLFTCIFGYGNAFLTEAVAFHSCLYIYSCGNACIVGSGKLISLFALFGENKCNSYLL